MKSLDDVGGRHPEFRDRKPDLSPLPPVEPGPPPLPPRVPEYGWIAWLLLGAELLGLGIVILVVRTSDPVDATSAFLRQLRAATEQYGRDFGNLPDGDGEGSAGLRRALAFPGRRGVPYLAFGPSGADARGDLLTPERGRVHYRAPGRIGAYDLWVDPPPKR